MEFLNPEQQQPGAKTARRMRAEASRGVTSDQLVEMRLYVPGQAGKDDGSDAASAAG